MPEIAADASTATLADSKPERSRAIPFLGGANSSMDDVNKRVCLELGLALQRPHAMIVWLVCANPERNFQCSWFRQIFIGSSKRVRYASD